MYYYLIVRYHDGTVTEKVFYSYAAAIMRLSAMLHSEVLEIHSYEIEYRDGKQSYLVFEKTVSPAVR